MFVRVLIVLFLSMFIQTESTRRSLFAEEFESRVDDLVAPLLKEKPYLGLVVGIVKQDGETESFGYGNVKLADANQKPDEQTIFEIGSITKVFTATVLAIKIKKGSIKLEDFAQTHLPDEIVLPRYKGKQITLLHLATHKSGLPVQPPLIGLFALATKDPANPYAEYGKKNLAATLSKLKLSRLPGGKFVYSNLGMGLLGHALVNSSQANSYDELITQQICNPLGMKDTRVKLSASQNLQFANGHKKNGNQTSPWEFASLEGCGALRSNVHDLLFFATANLGLKKTTLDDAFQMTHQPRSKITIPNSQIGLSWICLDRKSPKQTLRWHNGGTGGYRSMMILNLEKKTAVIILSNSAHSVDSLAFGILKLIDKVK